MTDELIQVRELCKVLPDGQPTVSAPDPYGGAEMEGIPHGPGGLSVEHAHAIALLVATRKEALVIIERFDADGSECADHYDDRTPGCESCNDLTAMDNYRAAVRRYMDTLP